MADLSYYAAKIAECLRLLESSNDPLYRDVYQAMANEFTEKHAALAQGGGQAVPPSSLLTRVSAAPPNPAASASSRPAATQVRTTAAVGAADRRPPSA